MALTYYSQRKSIKADGTYDTVNNRYGTRQEMERQFHLYCASACSAENTNLLDEIEWGTLENGILEPRKVYTNEPEPTPEPEPEPEPEDEPEEPEA